MYWQYTALSQMGDYYYNLLSENFRKICPGMPDSYFRFFLHPHNSEIDPGLAQNFSSGRAQIQQNVDLEKDLDYLRETYN